MKKKLISIIINCFNGEKFLSQTLQSVISQKYKKFEVIFIDNCSTDKSAKIFQSIKDRRFRYFKTKKKINLYKARNFAIKRCKGEFVAFLDADDWWDKNFLSSRKRFYNSSKKYGFSFSNCFHYFEKKKNLKIFFKSKLPSGFILDDLLQYYSVKLSTIIVKKRLIDIYKFNARYNIIGDYDFIIKIAKKFYGMSFQDKLVYIRIHSQNYTHNNRGRFYKEFKHWTLNQNYKDFYFKKNKLNIMNQLQYLKLIDLLLNYKKFKLLFDILKYPFGLSKLKLLLIYFLPKFLIKLKIKYL